MASFTDQIPQFNPYIQQLPVEAMVAVGMEKQKRYDEGIQKIQSEIDKVAGMDIYRDVDRSYLQSKLNELGNNLKTVAAGDYSNFQLVNSVSGMANQIGKDPIVENAVKSTAKLRKALSSMEEYKKKGKSDKNNEDYFLQKIVNPYLQSGIKDDRGNLVSFEGDFTPYVDIMGIINENVKNAGLDTKLIQQMYQTDDRGKIVLDEKGNPIPARTMTEVETSSNLKQIKSIVENVLTRGDVQAQLDIDGWANTRGVSVDNVIKSFNAEFKKKMSDVDLEILEINTLLTGKVSESEKASLEQELKEYSDLKERYKAQYVNLEKLAVVDPERFKQTYYKSNYENNLIEQFTKYEKREKNVKSPLTEQLNWEAEYAFKERKEAFDQRIASANLGIAQARLQLDQMEFQANYELDLSTGKYVKKPDPGSAANLQLTADVAGEESRSALQRQESQVRVIQQTNDQIGTDLMYNFLYKLNNGLTKNGKPLTKTDVIRDIDKWAKANGESREQFLTRWVLNLNNKAVENGVKLSRSDAESISTFKTNHNNYTTLLTIGKLADDEALKKTGVNVREYTDSLNPINVKLKDGRSATITKEDILDYMLLIKNNDKGAEDRIVAKYGSLKDFPLNTAKAGYLSEAERETRQALQKQSGMYSIYAKDWDKFKEAAKIKNEYLSKVVNTDQVFSFGDTDEAGLKSAKNKMSAFISGASSLTGLNFNKAEALKALSDPGSKVSFKASAPFEEGGQWKGTAMITTEKGDIIEVDIPVQTDLEQLTGKRFNPYKVNPLKMRAAVSKFSSTNLGTFTTNPRAWESAAIDPENFASMRDSKKYIPLGADLNVLPKGGYTVTAYFKDKLTGKILKPVEFSRVYTSEEQPLADLGLLTESMLDKELK